MHSITSSGASPPCPLPSEAAGDTQRRDRAYCCPQGNFCRLLKSPMGSWKYTQSELKSMMLFREGAWKNTHGREAMEAGFSGGSQLHGRSEDKASVNPMGSFGAGMTLPSYASQCEKVQAFTLPLVCRWRLSLPCKVRQCFQSDSPPRGLTITSATLPGPHRVSHSQRRPARLSQHPPHTASTVWPKVTHLPRPQVHLKLMVKTL